jgi:hypothetical protein
VTEPEPCVLCGEKTPEFRKVIGQGLYYPGMSDEEHEKVASSVTYIPCHTSCYTELVRDD